MNYTSLLLILLLTPTIRAKDTCALTECCDCSNNPLHEAVFGGEIEVVKRLLANGANVDAQDGFDQERSTPLHTAVKGSLNKEMFNLLLLANASVHIRDKFNATPLWCAVRAGAPSGIVLSLLNAGSDPNVETDGQGMMVDSVHCRLSALQWVGWRYNGKDELRKVATYLMQAGAHLDSYPNKETLEQRFNSCGLDGHALIQMGTFGFKTRQAATAAQLKALQSFLPTIDGAFKDLAPIVHSYVGIDIQEIPD